MGYAQVDIQMTKIEESGKILLLCANQFLKVVQQLGLVAKG